MKSKKEVVQEVTTETKINPLLAAITKVDKEEQLNEIINKNLHGCINNEENRYKIKQIMFDFLSNYYRVNFSWMFNYDDIILYGDYDNIDLNISDGLREIIIKLEDNPNYDCYREMQSFTNKHRKLEIHDVEEEE